MLRDPAAALGEPGIANGAVVNEHFAGCRADSFGSGWGKGFRDSLVTLAVVVGTDIEIRVHFTPVPPMDLMVLLSPPRRGRAPSAG